jgi:polysaccharide biosynthesis/export protein
MRNAASITRATAVVAVLLFVTTLGFAQESIGSLNANASTRVSRAVSNPNYPVTPGDIYNLTWSTAYNGGTLGTGDGSGSTGENQGEGLVLYVDAEYNVNLEFFGSIDARGLTFQEFRDEVISIVQNAYPGSTIRLTIRSTGEVPVRLIGEVVTARTIPVWGLTRLGDLPDSLFTDYASTRLIEIESADGTTESYDLFRARRFGDRSQNPLLSVGDTIRVPSYNRRVQVSGEVRRPGTYELLPNEGVEKLLELAGGYTNRARLGEISLTQITPDARGAQSVAYLSSAELAESELEDGAVISVPSRLENRPVVFVEGAVAAGGGTPTGSTRISRSIRTDQRLSDFAPSIQGLFTPVSDLENAYIRRGELEMIPVDLIDILYGQGSLSNDPVLEPEDVLVVPFKQFRVTVLGAVNSPGSVPYVPNKTWRYYVEQSGGFNPDLNDRQQVKILDADDNEVAKSEAIGPEYTIRAVRNDVRFWYLRSADLATTSINLFNAIFSLLQTFDVVE